MFIRLICLYLCALATALPESFPLRDLAVDQAILLQEWRFQAEPAGSEVDWSGETHANARAEWTPVPVPGIWEQGPGAVQLPIPEQAGWFRTLISVPALEKDQEWALCFLGVKYISDVFVNGEYIGVHRGGYTPFLFSLNDLPPDTQTLEIVVRVDNRLNDRSVPKRNTGWEIYGGIDREVYLLRRPSHRPENLFVQTFRDEKGEWILHLQAETVSNPTQPLHIRLSLDDQTLQSHTLPDWQAGIDLRLALDHPVLWSPDSPTLYQLELTWGDHRIQFPVGVRELVWKEGKLFLNGRPLWLQGFGQHEFFPKAGSILSPGQRRRDLEMMKTLYNANALRTGHYPHHPDLFNLADEIGLLLFTEVPVWQNQSASLTQPEVWENWIVPQIDEMVISYRNHPSVFGWGVLNEIGNAHAYVRQARARIQTLDPTRGVAAVMARTEDVGINALTDFAARNLHYGWYHSRSVYKLREGLQKNIDRAQGRPLWVAELGGMSTPGRLGGGYNDQIRGTETYQDKMTRFGLQYILSRADELAGISLWTWSDYEKRGSAHNHGILTAKRAPKLAAYTAMNLMRPPLVALGTEARAVVPVGESFEAQLFVFSRTPRPGEPVKLRWQIRSATTVKKEGSLNLTLSENLTTPAGDIQWAVTEKQDPSLHLLYLELQDASGTFLHSQAIPFEASDTTRPGILQVPPHPDGQEHLAEFYGMTYKIYPQTGFMFPLPSGEYEITLEGRVYPFNITSGKPTQLPWEN